MFAMCRTQHMNKFIFCPTFLLCGHFLFFLIPFYRFFFWPLSWEKLSQTRAVKARKSNFPEYQWVIVRQHPALPTIQHQPFQVEMTPLIPSQRSWRHTGQHRAAAVRVGGSCSPFPRTELSLASNRASHKPYLCVRGGKTLCTLDCGSLSCLSFGFVL